MITSREINRKGIHILFGVLFIGLVIFFGTRTSLAVLFCILLAGGVVSLLIRNGIKVLFLNDLVASVERQNEKSFPGKAALLFVFSAILLLAFFSDSRIVLAALSVQVFADPAAAIVGQMFGKHRLFQKKTIEGSAACLVVAALCLSFFYPFQIAAAGALVATIVEVLPLDDNLWVPLITATSLRALVGL